MRKAQPKHRPLRLTFAALAAAALVAVAAVACGGDGDSSSDGGGSPTPGSTVVSAVTPGAGIGPIQAVGTYVDSNGLNGHQLSRDPEDQAVCPVEDVEVTAIPGTPTLVSRIFLGQFCITPSHQQPVDETTLIVELPETGEEWEFKLEFDADDALWKVTDVDKISD